MGDFLAATWNTAGGTGKDAPTANELDPVVRQLERRGVSVALLQELTAPGVLSMFRARGWRIHRHRPQYGIAWRPELWTAVRPPDGVQLADTRVRRASGSTFTVEAARGVLCDRDGRSLTALSYHTPSAVQRAHPAPGRIRALREAMHTLHELEAAAQSRACLFGGDDNVDERLHYGPWRFMLQRATGLELVQAPGPTHAGGRRIDDFRTRGLHAGHGETLDGAGDHRVHVRAFGWL